MIFFFFFIIYRFHSLHHTQFRTNYCLFMPFYDYIYGTMDKSTDSLYETSLTRPEEKPNVVHLTHLTTPESIYQLRIGFASLASRPQKAQWYLWVMWPVTCWSMLMTCIHGRTFVLDRNALGKLKLQSWAIPRYNRQVRVYLSTIIRIHFFKISYSLVEVYVVGIVTIFCVRTIINS